MRVLRLLLVAAWSLLVVLPATAARPLRLFLCAPAGAVEHHAERELTHYLRHLTSREIERAAEPAQADFVLGTAASLPAELGRDLLLPMEAESFALATREQATGNQIVICGRDPAGLLYGCYEFLERYLAVVARTPVADLSFHVPAGAGRDQEPTALLLNVRQTPFYPARGLQLSFIGLGTGALLGRNPAQPHDADVWRAWSDWSARHRLNFISSWTSGESNWWEFVPTRTLARPTPWTAEEMEEAARRRRALLVYARERALAPYLMNFFPGRGSAHLSAAYPELFTRSAEPHMARFCYQPALMREAFLEVTEAVVAAYPELAGLQLRRSGESYPCECDHCRGRDDEFGRDLLQQIIERATRRRGDVKFLVSGYAEPDYAAPLPTPVWCMVKWGNDWDPVPTTGRSAPYLRRYGSKAALIDVALPAEESFPFGLVQHRQLEAGIREHASRPSDFTNLRGFAAALGDSDFGFITELNFIVFARLLRDPLGTDVPLLVRSWLSNRFGPEAAEDLFTSLDLQSETWRLFFCAESNGGYEFLRLAPFANWSRFGDLFLSYPRGGLRAFDFIMAGSDADLRQALERLRPLLDQQRRAFALVRGTAGDAVPAHGRVAHLDYLLQTEAGLRFLESRAAFVGGVLALRQAEAGTARHLFSEAIAANTRLREIVQEKPNNVGYGDRGGNIAEWERSRLLEGIGAENDRLRFFMQ